MKLNLFLAALALASASSHTAHAASVIESHLVKDTNVEIVDSGSRPASFVTISGKVYFAAFTPETGTELFVTDAVGTVPQLAYDFARGTASSLPTALTEINGLVLVEADDAVHGKQLWSVNLSLGIGTRLTSFSSFSGTTETAIIPLGHSGTRFLFLRRSDNAYWSTDGTVAGTSEISSAQGLSRADGKACELGASALIATHQNFNSIAFWRTDGSIPGTSMIASSPGIEYGSRPSFAVGDGAHCYFLWGTTGGWTLWRSDGSTATTRLVAQSTGSAAGLAMMGGNIYIAAADSSRFVVWRSNGDDAQLAAVHDVPFDSFGDAQLTVNGGKLAFVSPAAQFTRKVFVTDGTQAGTQQSALGSTFGDGPSLRALGAGFLVSNQQQTWRIDPATLSVTFLNASGFANLGDMAVVNGVAISNAQDEYGLELWRSDGTTVGTYRLQDIWTDNQPGILEAEKDWPTTVADGDVLMLTNIRRNGPQGSFAREIWRTDGSEAGTWRLSPATYSDARVSTMVALGNGAFFIAEGPNQYEYYRTNRDLSSVTPVLGGLFTFGGMQSLPAAAGVLFNCDVPGDPKSLCALRIGDALPSVVLPQLQDNGFFASVGFVGNVGVFANGSTEPKLWRSDGTAPGTFQISDLHAQLASTSPSLLATSTVFNGKLYFPACVEAGRCGLAVTDGSVAGTSMVAILPGWGLESIVALGNRIVFTQISNNVTQLWSSDGTAQGTLLLYDFGSNDVSSLVSAGNAVHLISGCRGYCDGSYWVTDGTKGNLRAISMPPGFSPSVEAIAALDSDNVIFSCHSATTGLELCATDAVTQTSRFLRDVYPGVNGSSPRFLARTSNASYFTADDGHHGLELWQLKVASDSIFQSGFQQ
ncbi:MAG: hypothetical protein ABI411_15715 [Tahibacter sp.]